MTKYYLIIPASLLIVVGVFVVLSANKPKTELISPTLPAQTQTSKAAPEQSLLYYINTSQEFLNKAQVLSTNTNQTPAEKQEILDTARLALESIAKGIAIYPQDDRGFAQRATIYEAVMPVNVDFRKMAIADLEQAVVINRQNPLYLARLANLYLQIPDFNNAARVWYKAYLINPVDVQTLYNLADALEKSGQGVQSFHYFEKLISLLPANDTNLATIKNRQQGLAELIQNSRLEYLSEPELFVQAAPTGQQTEPLGIEDLPLQQAAAANQVIIAAPNDSDPPAGEAGPGSVSSNSKGGEAILPANEKEVTIKTPLVKDNTFIYVKAISTTQNKVIYVSSKNPEEGYFKVAIDTPINSEIKFNWWIIK
ncbi:hypothetical protein COT65_02470 [Candidatus Shapirobacteria bacterium CG09_land_8_20_14_0_10_47_13]|uniref:Uncharacterized protein n=1 Tax=Candidatus Shapirobacteria bacterium CG09_land_8_20_14_0_10_47_13 TaxID=1974481 RepID=A0A2H0WM72_9BACT|nr:MAG: hypothetical protein COT65_02470 [Candidatus Shapirobacteria bacterium CG09_land_8_20_14_0_10_47_13]